MGGARKLRTFRRTLVALTSRTCGFHRSRASVRSIAGFDETTCIEGECAPQKPQPAHSQVKKGKKYACTTPATPPLDCISQEVAAGNCTKFGRLVAARPAGTLRHPSDWEVNRGFGVSQLILDTYAQSAENSPTTMSHISSSLDLSKENSWM